MGVFQDDLQLAWPRFGMDQFDRDVLLFELFVQVADEGFLVVQGNRVGKNGIINGTIRLGIYQAKFEFSADGLKSKRQSQKSEANIQSFVRQLATANYLQKLY